MPSIPLPSRSLQAGSSPVLGAPDVLASPDVTGRQLQQIGEATTQFGVGTARAAGYLEDAAADAEADESLAVYAELQQKDLEGEKGFLTLVGREAVVGVGAARKQLQARRQEVAASIKNPVARELFSQKVRGLELEGVSRIDRHHASSTRAWRQGALASRLEMAVDRYRSTIQDPPPQANGGPPRSAVHREVALRTAQELADAKGLSDEERQQLLLETTTKLHAGVIEDLLANGRADQARKYLDGAGPELLPGAAAGLQKLVRTATVNDEGVRLALQLMAPPPEKVKPSLNGHADPEPDADRLQREETERLLRLRAAHDELDRRFQAGEVSAEVRARAISEIRSMEGQRREDLAVRSQQVVQQAEKWLRDNPFAGADALPADLRVAVDTLGLGDTVNSFADGRRYTTDPQAFLEVLQAPPDALRRVSRAEMFAAYRGRLSDKDLDHALRLHAAAHDPKDVKLTQVYGLKERVLDVARQANILPPAGTASADQAADFARFQQEADRRFAKLGREAKPEEEQAILEAVAMDKVYRDVGGIFQADPLEVVSTLTKEEMQAAYVQVDGENVPLQRKVGDVFVPRVPHKDMVEIAEDLLSAGQRPTQQAIMEAWVRHYRGKK